MKWISTMAVMRICPVCKRALSEDISARKFRPFCSKRCADVDLGRWLNGAYAIPVVAEDEEEGEADSAHADDEDGAGRIASHNRH
jgi:uncharacterized protein